MSVLASAASWDEAEGTVGSDLDTCVWSSGVLSEGWTGASVGDVVGGTVTGGAVVGGTVAGGTVVGGVVTGGRVGASVGGSVGGASTRAVIRLTAGYWELVTKSLDSSRPV